MKALLVLLFLCGCAVQRTPPLPLKFVTRVTIVSDHLGYGTGVFIRKDEVLTCAHVVGEAHWLMVSTLSGAPQIGTVVKLDRKNDLALLRVTATVENLVFADARKGDVVFAIGHPKSHWFHLSQGKVKSLGSHDRASMFTQPGSSGSPVFNQQGELVGQIQMYDPTTMEALFLPASKIREFLKGVL